MDLRSAGRSAGNPVTGQRRASYRQRKGLTAPAGWREEAQIVDANDRLRAYFDKRNWWIGYRRTAFHRYICPLPTVVIRWPLRWSR